MRDGNAAGAASPVRAFVNSAWTQLLIPPLVVVRWWTLFAQFLARAIARDRVEAFQRATMALESVRQDVASTIRSDDLFETRFLLTTRESGSRTGSHDRSNLLVFGTSLRPRAPPNAVPFHTRPVTS